MAALIALMAICLFAAGVAVGIIGVVAVAIRREERNLTLTNAAPGQVASAGRWLNGLYIRAAAAPPPETQRGRWPGPGSKPTSDTPNGPLAGPPGRTSQEQHGLHRHEEARQPTKIFMRITRTSRMTERCRGRAR
jgi:hypothetical protein